jgi:hypothetical protein
MPSPVENAVTKLLKEFQAIAGILHVFVCDNAGTILGSLSTVEAAPGTLARASTHLNQSLIAFQKMSGKPREMETRFDRGTLIVREMGNAVLGVVCASTVDRAMLRLTLDVAATTFEQDANAQRMLAQVVSPLTAIQVMASFVNVLVEEFGDRGMGRQKLLDLMSPVLTKLGTQYPFFQAVKIADGRIDLSPLALSAVPMTQLVPAWGDLVTELCIAAARVLGERSVAMRYHHVGGLVYEKNVSLFETLGLESVIPSLDLPAGL